jgi:hypothetical protein
MPHAQAGDEVELVRYVTRQAARLRSPGYGLRNTITPS